MAAMDALHIFKAGRQTAMNGAEIEFSEADLAATVAAYDPALHEAPIVVGHPRTDAPAYGWVRALSSTGADLQADPHQVDAAFAELVRAGRFKKISAAFYPPDSPSNPVPGVYYLRHVGFLGAQPPAVKGLRQAEFADAAEDLIEFSDWGHDTSAGLFRRLREWLLGQFGQETADQVLPDWQIESLREAARQDDDPRPVFSEPTPKEESVTPEQAAALEAENNRLKTQLAAAEAERTAAAAAKRHGAHLAYAETLLGVPPKHRATVVAFLDFADSDTPVEFGEGDERQPLATAFKNFLNELPPVIEFEEVATKGAAAGPGADADTGAEFGEVDPERLKQHRAIQAHMAQHKVDYATAARAVLR